MTLFDCAASTRIDDSGNWAYKPKLKIRIAAGANAAIWGVDCDIDIV
jgi:hypothetical protein